MSTFFSLSQFARACSLRALVVNGARSLLSAAHAVSQSTYSLYDALGQPSAHLMMGTEVETPLSLTGMATGLYAVRVSAGGRLVQTGKIVKLP